MGACSVCPATLKSGRGTGLMSSSAAESPSADSTALAVGLGHGDRTPAQYLGARRQSYKTPQCPWEGENPGPANWRETSGAPGTRK